MVDPMKCTPCYLKAYAKNKLIYEGDFYTDCGVGNYIEYYSNGNIKVKGQYKRNLIKEWNLSKSNEWCAIKVGVWEYYDEKGNLIKSEEYQNGLLKE
jgi:antitoxin component YwqK of YwqJK toxin-antitoxin module